MKSGASLRGLIRCHWGYVVCVVEIMLALVKTVWKAQIPHYITFISPVSYLWRGQDPYGINFIPEWIPDTAFPYSPASALFYFSLFSPFSHRVGVSLFMVSSLLCLMAGHHFLF